MSRAITAPELIKLRRDGQSTQLYLSIEKPTQKFTTLLDTTPTSLDRVTEFAYTGHTGVYSDVKAGMTMWVGTGAGMDDIGRARIRKDASATTLFIGETSELALSAGQAITVFDQYGIWARHGRLAGTVLWNDWDIEYSDQNTNTVPVPVMGTDKVAKLASGTASVTFDASLAWSANGTVSAYSWSAPGSFSVTGGTTATPTITYHTTGQFRVYLTATANGVTSIGVRTVFIWDDTHLPVTQFKLNSCRSNGDPVFSVTMYAEDSFLDVRDGALVILHAVDHYPPDNVSLGPVSGSENIIAIGRIAGDTINWSNEYTEVSFDVYGPLWWLDKTAGYPTGLTSISGTPSTWLEMQNLTVDKALWYLVMWRSTIGCVTDVFPTGNALALSSINGTGSLKNQFRVIAYQTILAETKSNMLGQIYTQKDPQIMTATERAALPVVMDITTVDWHDWLTIEENPTDKTAVIEISGVKAGSTTPLQARAPGNVYGHIGRSETLDRLLLESQAKTNELAGLLLAWRNNDFKRVDIKLAANNRFFDVTPPQYATLTIGATDTPRGNFWGTKNLIPRSISYAHDPIAGILEPDVEFETETFAENAVTVVTAGQPIKNELPTPPTPPITPPITWPPFPPGFGDPGVVNPNADETCRGDPSAAPNGPYSLFPPFVLQSDGTTTEYTYKPAWIRDTAATYKTTCVLTGTIQIWNGTDWVAGNPANVTMYAEDSQANIFYGSLVSSSVDSTGYGTWIFEFSVSGGRDVNTWVVQIPLVNWYQDYYLHGPFSVAGATFHSSPDIRSGEGAIGPTTYVSDFRGFAGYPSPLPASMGSYAAVGSPSLTNGGSSSTITTGEAVIWKFNTDPGEDRTDILNHLFGAWQDATNPASINTWNGVGTAYLGMFIDAPGGSPASFAVPVTLIMRGVPPIYRFACEGGTVENVCEYIEP